jgi:hypothetical protein
MAALKRKLILQQIPLSYIPQLGSIGLRHLAETSIFAECHAGFLILIDKPGQSAFAGS